MEKCVFVWIFMGGCMGVYNYTNDYIFAKVLFIDNIQHFRGDGEGNRASPPYKSSLGLFVDHSRFRKCQEGLEMANLPTLTRLPVWHVYTQKNIHATRVLTSSSEEQGNMFKNNLRPEDKLFNPSSSLSPRFGGAISEGEGRICRFQSY